MRMTKLLVVMAVATSMLFVASGAALGTQASKTDNGNRITVTFTKVTNCGPGGTNCTAMAECSGHNQHTPAAAKLLISCVCQYRDSSGAWHDIVPAKADSCSNSRTHAFARWLSMCAPFVRRVHGGFGPRLTATGRRSTARGTGSSEPARSRLRLPIPRSTARRSSEACR